MSDANKMLKNECAYSNLGYFGERIKPKVRRNSHKICTSTLTHFFPIHKKAKKRRKQREEKLKGAPSQPSVSPPPLPKVK